MSKLHKREEIVANAKRDFHSFIGDWITNHKLTSAEKISILSSEISSICKFQTRFDRHGDTNKPGGIE